MSPNGESTVEGGASCKYRTRLLGRLDLSRLVKPSGEVAGSVGRNRTRLFRRPVSWLSALASVGPV